MAAQQAGVQRFFYSSSACVYNARQAAGPERSRPYGEADAYPALPEDGYGWEKLFSERMCRHFREDFGLQHARRPLPQRLRPARHLDGGREKAPAGDLPQGDSSQGQPANHEIEIWGDGTQTRSFMYIDDCLKGIANDHGFRHSGADQPGLFGNGDHQSAGRHRRRHRRHQAQAELQPRRSQGRRWAATATTP